MAPADLESNASDAGSPSGEAAPQDPRSTGAHASKDARAKPKGGELWVKLVIAAVLALVLVAFVVWFAHYWTRGRFVQGTNDAYLQADQVTVSTRVSAFVDEVYVADNASVQKDQLLVRLNPRDPQAQVAQAQAQAAQGRASIDQVKAQVREQQATIRQNQAQLTGVRSKAVYSLHEADRYRPLAAAGVETNEKLAQMVQNRDQADASVVQTLASVAAAGRQIGVYTAQIETAQAQVREAQAKERQSQVDLDATLVRASVAGRIGDKQVRVGQYAPAGTRMMTVVPVDAVYLVANFKETQIGLMRAGQPVSIKLDALKGEVLHGTVESFSPGTGAQFALIPPNNATGNFTKIVQRVPVRIRIQAGSEARKVLVPGLSATVSVDTFGAKSDTQEQKEESKSHAEADRGQAQRQVQSDTGTHVVGPGTRR